MATNLTINGVTFAYPQAGDPAPWGEAMTNWASAVTTGMLQKAGGAFTLTADADFGPNYGLVAAYLKSRGTVASAGIVRLAKTESVAWRNNANNGNNTLATDASDQLLYNGVALASAAGLVPVASGGTNIASYTAGDMIYATAGTTLAKLAIGAANRVLTSNGSAPGWSLLVNANLDAAAAVARTKLASGTADHVVINDGSGVLSSEATLAKSRGGTGADNSSVTFPGSGTIVTEDGSQTLTNKTMSGASNTFSNIPYTAVTGFASSQVLADSPGAAAAGHGSSNTCIRRFTNASTTGTDITYADSAANGASFTINTAGLYSITYSGDNNSGGSSTIGISVNSGQLSTSIFTITTANRLAAVVGGSTDNPAVSVVARLAASDIIRPHTNGSVNATAASVQFRIVRIG